MLVIWMVVLLIWARTSAGSWGPLVNQTGKFATTGEFIAFFIVGLNANISYAAPARRHNAAHDGRHAGPPEAEGRTPVDGGRDAVFRAGMAVGQDFLRI